MASIRWNTENSFTVFVFVHRGEDGRQKKKTKTFKLPAGLTAKQREKRAEAMADEFEKELKQGFFLDVDGDKVTFAEYTQIWLESYAEKKYAPANLRSVKSRLQHRIIPALGQYKLTQLQPHLLLKFYNDLTDTETLQTSLYTPTLELATLIAPLTASDMVQAFGISEKTCRRLKRGYSTTKEVADTIAAALNVKVERVFDAHGSGRKLSSKSVKHHFDLVSSILAFAVKMKVLTENPADRVDQDPLKRYKPSFYDEEMLTELLLALETEPLKYQCMLWFALDTGARSGEVTGLKWSDISFDQGTVSIKMQRQYVAGEGILYKPPKTENGVRLLTLSPRALDMLTRYRSQQRDDMAALGLLWSPELYVFSHEDGTPISPQRPNAWLSSFLKRNDLPKITFHQLRHTNASLLIAEGVDIVTLSGRLGHADKNVTLGTYSHMIKSREVQVANRMEEVYRRLNQK